MYISESPMLFFVIDLQRTIYTYVEYITEEDVLPIHELIILYYLLNIKYCFIISIYAKNENKEEVYNEFLYFIKHVYVHIYMY